MRFLAYFLLLLPATAIEPADGVLFRESFDDDAVDSRGWYDGKAVRIAPEGQRGACIEYE